MRVLRNIYWSTTAPRGLQLCARSLLVLVRCQYLENDPCGDGSERGAEGWDWQASEIAGCQWRSHGWFPCHWRPPLSRLAWDFQQGLVFIPTANFKARKFKTRRDRSPQRHLVCSLFFPCCVHPFVLTDHDVFLNHQKMNQADLQFPLRCPTEEWRSFQSRRLQWDGHGYFFRGAWTMEPARSSFQVGCASKVWRCKPSLNFVDRCCFGFHGGRSGTPYTLKNLYGMNDFWERRPLGTKFLTANLLGFNLCGRGVVTRKCTPWKIGTALALLEPCWNLAGTFLNIPGAVLEPSWHGAGAFLERLLELCWKIPGTFLLGLCWNLPGILLELCWNIPGTFLLGLCWNLPGIFLELCWNIPGTFLLGPCWNLLGTVLEPCWNLVRFIMMELWRNLPTSWNFARTWLEPCYRTFLELWNFRRFASLKPAQGALKLYLKL